MENFIILLNNVNKIFSDKKFVLRTVYLASDLHILYTVPIKKGKA
jgi:hypothetical protein